MYPDEQRDATVLETALTEDIRRHPTYYLERLRLSENRARVAKPSASPPKPLPGQQTTGPARHYVTTVRDVRGAEALGRASDRTTEELETLLRAEQLPAALGALVNRLFFGQGCLRKPFDLTHEFSELVPELADSQRALCDRIHGEVRLLDTAAQLIPPRSHGPALRVERDRIMYCVHSTPVFQSNGYSVRTRGVAEGLKSAGAEVTVVARTGYPWDTGMVDRDKPAARRYVVEQSGISWVHTPEGNLSRSLPDDYIHVAADAFVREAKICRPSLIQAASNHRTALPALIAARRLGLPFVYEVRGLWEITEASAKPGWEDSERFLGQRELETLVASQADRVMAITEETRDELIGRGVEPDRIDILPNGVDVDQLLPLPGDERFAKRHGIDTDQPVVGFAGSFVDYEGLGDLLGAAEILKLRGRKVSVALAGGGGVESTLKELVKDRELHDVVRLVGRLPSTDIPRFLSCVDVVCCPRLSLRVTEMVSPLKPLEAFAAGKPVVLSDVSPHRVLVDDAPVAVGESAARGILHRAGDPVSIADAIERLLDHPEELQDMGRRAREWAVDRRQWSTLGSMVLESHRAARRHYTQHCEKGPRLNDLTVAVIADEFTSETLRHSVTLLPLDVEHAVDQLTAERPDLLFVESAWSGNNGQWHRKVGYYSAEEDSAIATVLRAARELGIPSVFWNKEDPVHIERFLHTASRCDHVFTTDAHMIPRYLDAGRSRDRSDVTTAASLPFYAQPRIHHPLPGTMADDRTISYAGTYYGNRYPERSEQLSSLLRVAQPLGLTIYDRQLANPGSPYHFPREFAASVAGNLPYAQVLDSYKAHVANLNVNSVTGSPSMFSRRVVEIAASGGRVLSTAARGVQETFGGVLPSTDERDTWRALLGLWCSSAEHRLRESWLQMRTILRAHTVDTALTVLSRTAGIPVIGPHVPTWGTDVDPEDTDRVQALLNQSLPPTAVRWTTLVDPSHESVARMTSAGVVVLSPGADVSDVTDWWGHAPDQFTRTWAEDLLWAEAWGTWDVLGARALGTEDSGYGVVARDRGSLDCGMIRSSAIGTSDGPSPLPREPRTLTLVMPPAPSTLAAGRAHPRFIVRDQSATHQELASLGTVLVAGHDLKFVTGWIEHLRSVGVEVLEDHWASHSDHDPELSTELLSRADTVLCEWGLGNAVWYSQHVRHDQRLVVRVHAQELRRDFLSRIRHHAVSEYVFVGELMRDAAVRSHGVPREKTVVIPNSVPVAQLDRPKGSQAHTTLGLVGMIPHTKRPDRAVDVLERVLERVPEATLRIKGKRPEDYPWMAQRPHELEWYQELDRRIRELNRRHGRDVVIFDPHGNDMADWFRDVGYALSVSDAESFHLTLPDGAASGAIPVSLSWPGADRIYPGEWLVPSTADMAERIVALSQDSQERAAVLERAKDFVNTYLDTSVVYAQLDRVMMDPEVIRETTAPKEQTAVVPTQAQEDRALALSYLREQLTESLRRETALAREVRQVRTTTSSDRQREKRDRDAKQKKIWWLESDRSRLAERVDELRRAALESKEDRDAKQKKIWWLESRLNQVSETLRTTQDERDRLKKSYRSLRTSVLGRTQAKIWDLRSRGRRR